jgi:Caspase domain
MKLIISLLLLGLLPQILFAQTFHLITICATNDKSIGEACQVNKNLIHNFSKSVSKSIGYRYQVHEFSANRVHSDSIQHFADTFRSCNKDDIIFLYYTGHGINSGKNKWPRLLISGNNRLCIDELHEQLLTKKARFTLTLSESCNFKMTETTSMMRAKKTPLNPAVIASLSELFTKYKGDILSNSADVGEAGHSTSVVGGFFTNAFLDVLRTFPSAPVSKDSWEKIFEQIQTITSQTAKGFAREQTPIYQIRVFSNTP